MGSPVVESFTSKAYAESVQYYCSSCWGPSEDDGSEDDNNQDNESDDKIPKHTGVAGAGPTTAQDCAAYCANPNNVSGYGYSNPLYSGFTWCGPSATKLNYSESDTAGCYRSISSGNSMAADTCTSGQAANPVTNEKATNGVYMGNN